MTIRTREPSLKPFLHKFYTIIIKKIHTIVDTSSILFQLFTLQDCISYSAQYQHTGVFCQFGGKVYTDGIRSHHKKRIVYAYARTYDYVSSTHTIAHMSGTRVCYLCVRGRLLFVVVHTSIEYWAYISGFHINAYVFA